MVTLGCSEELSVFVTERGGSRPLVELPYTSVTWERALNSISKAEVEVGEEAGAAFESCCDDLRSIEPWVHEIRVLRNNAEVWMGPLTDMDFSDEKVTLTAEDLSAWLAERRIHETHRYVGVDLAEIFGFVVIDAMSIDNSPGLTATVSPSGVYGDRTFLASERLKADEVISELARSEIDWTVIGRKITAGNLASSSPLSLVDAHIQVGGSVKVDRTVATEVSVLGSGRGESGPTVVGQVSSDPGLATKYGVHEHVASEDNIRDAESALAAAQSRLDLFRRPPTVFDGGVLEEGTPIGVNDLVPGMTVQVNLQDFCRPVTGEYRLTKVKGTHTDSTDEIEIDLQPLSLDADT